MSTCIQVYMYVCVHVCICEIFEQCVYQERMGGGWGFEGGGFLPSQIFAHRSILHSLYIVCILFYHLRIC